MITAATQKRFLGIWLALLGVLLLLRLYSWHSEHIESLSLYPLVILHALGSDVIGAGLFAAMLYLPFKLTPLRAAGSLLLGYILAANLQNIGLNNNNINIIFYEALKEPAFLWGNALSPAVLGSGAIIACLIWIAQRVLLPRIEKTSESNSKKLLAALAALSMLTLTTPISPYMDWVFTNLVPDNAQNATHMLLFNHDVRQRYFNMKKPPQIFAPLFAHDLQGEQWLHATGKPNILVLSLEDTSMDTLDSGWAPKLRTFADQHILYPNMIALNAETTNGMYALLCGDYPFMDNPDESLWWRPYGTQKNCLPKLLREHGYHNIFMTATTIGWYATNLLIRPMKFNENFERQHFQAPDVFEGHWGINDSNFDQAVLDKIRKQPKDKPWFLMAMTIGTHPDYDATPPDYAKQYDSPASAAFHFMDDKIAALLESLKSEGLLDNTLLIITSDESREKRNQNEYGDFSGNRSFMIVAEPGGGKQRIDTPFMHSDLQTSVLDYLGIEDPGGMGRSIFRTYTTNRDLIFGNVYHNRIFWVHGNDQSVTNCTNKPWSCVKLTPDTPGQLFNIHYSAEQETPENSAFLQHFLEYNDILRMDRRALKRVNAPTENK